MRRITEQPEQLLRGRFAAPQRDGDVILRRHAGASGVRALLEHYERAGCRLTPRFLGFAPDGRERLSYIAGDTGYPPLSPEIRSDAALVSVAEAIRALHDGSEGFESEGLGWSVNEAARPGTTTIIGHHDLAPWNIVFDGTRVTGVIDWDGAGPSTRAWDLGYLAHHFVPFHPAGDLAAHGWPEEIDRHRRLHLLVHAYGGGVTEQEVVDAAILRLASMGAYIARQVQNRHPDFAVHAEEDHASGYFAAAADLSHRRPHLLREAR